MDAPPPAPCKLSRMVVLPAWFFMAGLKLRGFELCCGGEQRRIPLRFSKRHAAFRNKEKNPMGQIMTLSAGGKFEQDKTER